MKYFRYILLLSIFCNFNTLARIRFSNGVAQKHKEFLKNDLECLQGMFFEAGNHREFLNIFDLEVLDSSTLYYWLNERVSFVVEDRPISELPANSSKEKYVYPVQRQEESVSVMYNLGASLYKVGKAYSELITLDFEDEFGRETIKVTSPRAGIVQIGEGLFDISMSVNYYKPESMPNTLRRLEVFFHEARHSDGHGESLTFPHELCPKGHAYEGQPSCDKSSNGAYKISSLILKELIRACSECSKYEKVFLKGILSDISSRILSKATKALDPRAEVLIIE